MMYRWLISASIFTVVITFSVSAQNIDAVRDEVMSRRGSKLIEIRKRQADDHGTETPGAPGMTYYFSSSTGDDSRDCKDRDKPCKSTEKFVKVVNEPGEVGLFKRGDEWVDQSWIERMASGKKDMPITAGAYGKGLRPVFTKGKQTASNYTKVAKKSFVNFDRLVFRKMQSFHIIESSHHLNFTYVVFREAGNACVHVAGARDKDEPHNIQFIKNTVEECGKTGHNGEGFYISESIERYGFGGRDILIKDTVIRNTQHEPVNIKSGTRRVQVEGSVIYNYVPNRTAGKRDPGLINARLSSDPQAGHVFTKNIIVGNKGHGSNKDAAFFLVAGTKAFNNLVVGNDMACVRGDKGGKFYLNTCVRNVRGFLNPEPVKGKQRLDIADVKCNIGASIGRNIPDDDNQFVDARHDDYRLRKPNVDAAGGCDLTDEMTDILDRPRKGRFSFGAFEFGGEKPPPPPPEGDCDTLFGAAPDYTLCDETDTTCSFSATTSGTTCEGICRAFGTKCIEAIDNKGASCQAMPNSEDMCKTPRENEICVCSKGGDEPPPPPPMKPDPVSIGWCLCGCAKDDTGSVGMIEGLSDVGVCSSGCAPCKDGVVNVPLDKDQVIGPVMR